MHFGAQHRRTVDFWFEACFPIDFSRYTHSTCAYSKYIINILCDNVLSHVTKPKLLCQYVLFSLRWWSLTPGDVKTRDPLGEDCAVYYRGRWGDVPCSIHVKAICELSCTPETPWLLIWASQIFIPTDPGLTCRTIYRVTIYLIKSDSF